MSETAQNLDFGTGHGHCAAVTRLPALGGEAGRLNPLGVSLDHSDFNSAAYGGYCRNFYALTKNLNPGAGRVDFGFDTHIRGALVEMALAKHLRIFWRPNVGTLDTAAGDVTTIFQCKGSHWQNPRLIIPQHNSREFIYVLGRIDGWARDWFTVTLLGWEYGVTAMAESRLEKARTGPTKLGSPCYVTDPQTHGLRDCRLLTKDMDVTPPDPF